MTMQVDPNELRSAARSIQSGWNMPTLGSAEAGISKAAAGIHGTDTSGAITSAGAAVERALAVLKSRRDEFVHVLTVSADRYTGTDETAAARLKAIGDLNRPTGR